MCVTVLRWPQPKKHMTEGISYGFRCMSVECFVDVLAVNVGQPRLVATVHQKHLEDNYSAHNSK